MFFQARRGIVLAMWAQGWDQLLDRARQSGLERALVPNEGISFSHNDYLGLSTHPDIIRAGKRALEQAGAGARSSRLLGGNSCHVLELEKSIAGFFDAPAALFFSSGYAANLGVIRAVSQVATAVASDEQIHASLIDGIRLTGLPRQIVAHNQWGNWTAESGARWLLVAESLYSMSGDWVDSLGLMQAWDRSQGFLVLDEAHAAGIAGPSGRGLSAPWRDWSRMAVVVTFGKAFGVAGAAVLCSTALKQWLVQSARTFIYSTAPPPAVCACVSASLEVMSAEGERLRMELKRRSGQLRQFLTSHGVPAGSTPVDSPIVPIFIEGNDRALRFSQFMRDSHWDLRAIRYPTVPAGSERIRVSVNLVASQQQLQAMAEEVVRQWKVFL